MTTGIYLIQHKASGKRYIGSSINIEQRWRQHRHSLSRGKHSSKELQALWDDEGRKEAEKRHRTQSRYRQAHNKLRKYQR